MYRIRQVVAGDLDALWDLICQASAGMTSLQIDKATLQDRLELSTFAFSRTSEKPEGAPYVFALEDQSVGKIVGTSCIFSKTGGYQPQYSYRVETERASSSTLGLEMLVHSLHLVKVHDGPTEIGSLFLQPDYRGRGCGKLLSLCRFLYMANHPKRFASQTIAEMRGYQDAEGHSPFWDAIGAHFFKIDFPSADSLSMVDKTFIEELMPKYPIYLELLPQSALDAIGKVHDQTRPALAMLEGQGFQRNNLIDIFDAGPVMACPTQQIRTVADSRLASWTNDPLADRSTPAIVARGTPPFLAIETSIQCDGAQGSEHVVLDLAAIDDLQLRSGELVRFIALPAKSV
ncbi:arginine N-succinyltransferase [Pirellulaceae bacterium SH467]